jgi:hypothetical protein
LTLLEAISKILDAVSLRPSKARLDSGFGFENLSLTRGEVFLRWLLIRYYETNFSGLKRDMLLFDEIMINFQMTGDLSSFQKVIKVL